MQQQGMEQTEEEKDEFFDAPPERAPVPETPGSQEKKKKIRRAVAVLLALVMLVVGFAVGWFVRYYTLDSGVREFLWALNVAEKNYYYGIDTDEVYANADPAKGVDGLFEALNGMLDPYSSYYTAEEIAAVEASGAGQEEGFGISFYGENTEEGRLIRFFSIVENSPAQAAGLQKGMYVLQYGASESEMQSGTEEEFSSFLSEGSGKAVLLCGFRPDGSDAAYYTVERAAYQAFYCSYRDSETSFAFRGDTEEIRFEETFSPIEGLDDSTAYIRIDEFSGFASDEFAVCLDKMCERGRTDLILDLRSNGGGYLSILQNIASYLLRDAAEEAPFVQTATFRNGRTLSYRVTMGNLFDQYFEDGSRVTVLADENTASASEALIGALVDYGTIGYGDIYLRAQEDGTARTYGKGIMQSFFSSLSGSSIKLTTATLGWPLSGTCIHGKGITSEDGANAVRAELVWGETDVMLDTVVAAVCGV